jgi:hypothetical protein
MFGILASWMTGVPVWVLLSAEAFAGPGDHIRVGDVELAPDLDLGAEVRTNVYRDEAVAVPAANFRIAPGLLAAAQGDDHEFRGSGEWVLRKYFFVADERIPPLPAGSSRVENLDRFDEFSVGAGADTFKRNVIGFRISDDMALRNFRSDAEFADIPYTSQLRNTVGAGLRINPGPALEFVPGGQWTWDSFRVPAADGADRALNNRNTFGPVLDAKWAFLPRTAVVANASWMVNDWQNNVLDSAPEEEFGAEVALPNSNHVKTMAGIDGRFTDRVFAQLMVGYGVAMYNEDTVEGAEAGEGAGDDATGGDGFLMKAQLRYSLTPSDETRRGSSIAAGYVRDFKPSFFTNFIQVNQLFADYQGRVGDLRTGVRYELRFEDYHGEVARNDIVNRVNADLTYPAADWASFTAGGWWQQRASSENTVEYDDVNFHLLTTFVY